MAVLCLPMLEAASAGVVYTADPTASNASTVAIHAVRGLGESLVTGMVSPQRFDMTRDEIPGAYTRLRLCSGSRPLQGKRECLRR